MLWNSVLKPRSEMSVQVIVRCTTCGYEDARTTADAARDDLKKLLEELS